MKILDAMNTNLGSSWLQLVFIRNFGMKIRFFHLGLIFLFFFPFSSRVSNIDWDPSEVDLNIHTALR